MIVKSLVFIVFKYLKVYFKFYFCLFICINVMNDFIIFVYIVEVGGFESVRLGRNDFVFIKGVFKLLVMVFRLIDKLFLKVILIRFIVYGIKDFELLDLIIIFVIKSE